MIGAALLYMVDESSSTASIYGYSTLLGLADGAFAQSSYLVASVKAHPMRLPVAIDFITMS